MAWIVFILCLLFPSYLFAATYYVQAGGSGGSNCSSGTNINTPLSSILNGVPCVHAGDTLYIRQGTYAESIDDTLVTIASGTGWDNPVTIASYPGEIATLQRVSIRDQVISYVIFDRLTVDAGGSPSTTVEGNDALQFAFQSHLRFSNGELRNANHHVVTGGQGSDLQIINNIIHGAYVAFDPSPWPQCNNQGCTTGNYCFYFNAHDSLIEGNTIYDCSQYGIHMYWGGCSSCINNNIIRNNTFYNNAYDDGQRGSSGASLLVTRGVNVLIYNNIFRDSTTPHHASAIEDHNENDGIYNNTIYNTQGIGIYLYPGSSGTTVRNNIIYQTSQQTILDQGSGAFFSNNLEGIDPLFVNPSAHNLMLQLGSQAIDTGFNLSGIVNTDIAGLARPQGSGYDKGAYEFAPGTTGNSAIITKGSFFFSQ